MRYSGTEFYFKHFNFFFFLKGMKTIGIFHFCLWIILGIYLKEFFLDVYIYK